MASEQTFFCEDESASHMTTYDRVPVLVTTVDISPGVSVTLSVYPGDDPCAVAQAFCAQHNLADSVVGPLTDHIEENLREEESIDEGIDEGGTPPLEGDVPPQAARGSDVPVGSKSMGSSAPSNSDPLMNRANESVAEVAAALESMGLGEWYMNNVPNMPSADVGRQAPALSLGKVRPAAANSSLGAEFFGSSELPTTLQRTPEEEEKGAAERLYADHFRRERMLEEQRRIQELEMQLKMQQAHCTDSSRAMTAHRTAKGYSSYGERLYKEGVEDAQKREALRLQAQSELEKQEMADVTFRPQISKLAQSMKAKGNACYLDGGESDAWTRLYHANAVAESKKMAKHEAIRREQDELEMKECSFHPQLSKKSERMMERRRLATSGTLQAHDRLHYQGVHQRANWEMKREQMVLPEEATFRPEINQASARRAARFNKDGPVDVAERLLIRGQVYHERLQSARAELYADVDPVTGQKLFQPKVNGRVPKNRQDSTGNVGQHLYQEALESAKRMEEFRNQTNHQVDMEASKTHVNASSQRMIERLKLDRIKAVFAYLARTPADCLPPESIDIVAIVSNEVFMDTIDPEVRADVELAAKIALRRKKAGDVLESAGRGDACGPRGDGREAMAGDDDDDISVYITETEFVECMYEVIDRTRGYTRTYLLPMPGTRVKWEEPTFKPSLSQKSMHLASRTRPPNMPNHEILYNSAADTSAKIERLKQELEEQEMKLCTFEPKLMSNLDSRPSRGKVLRQAPREVTHTLAESSAETDDTSGTIQRKGIKSSLFHVNVFSSSQGDSETKPGNYEVDSPSVQAGSPPSLASLAQARPSTISTYSSAAVATGNAKKLNKNALYEGIDAIENEIKEAIEQLRSARNQAPGTFKAAGGELPEFNVDRKMAISLPEPDKTAMTAAANDLNNPSFTVHAEF